MTPLEAVENAIAEVGSVSPEKLATFVKRRFGIQVEPKFIPLYRATIQEKTRTVKVRLEARRIAEQAAKEAGSKKTA